MLLIRHTYSHACPQSSTSSVMDVVNRAQVQTLVFLIRQNYSQGCKLQCVYRTGTVRYDVNPAQVQSCMLLIRHSFKCVRCSSGTDKIVYVVNQAQVKLRML